MQKMANQVTLYGMNDMVGQLSFARQDGPQLVKPYSETTAKLIDNEVCMHTMAAISGHVSTFTQHGYIMADAIYPIS